MRGFFLVEKQLSKIDKIKLDILKFREKKLLENFRNSPQ